MVRAGLEISKNLWYHGAIAGERTYKTRQLPVCIMWRWSRKHHGAESLQPLWLKGSRRVDQLPPGVSSRDLSGAASPSKGGAVLAVPPLGGGRWRVPGASLCWLKNAGFSGPMAIYGEEERKTGRPEILGLKIRQPLLVGFCNCY